MAFRLESPAFDHGERIPERHAHPSLGEDVSPPLRWTDPPEETACLALSCEDPDAPTARPFVHWLLSGIPADRKELVENEGRRYDRGTNDFGEAGWGGPLPPEGHGPHRYHFRIYALDKRPTLPEGYGKDDLLKAIDGHVLAEAETIGSFER